MTRKTCRRRGTRTPDAQDAPSPPAAAPPAAAPPGPGGAAAHLPALDRGAMASLARLAGGLSPHAMVDAWGGWALHLARAPALQLELMDRAQDNTVKLGRYAAAQMTGQSAEKPFRPGPQDTRWSHQGWGTAPFALWQQGFLATQDWWEAATANLRGLRRQNAERTGFMMRQLLDTVSPASVPPANPEILERTWATAGRNLRDGAAQFADDARHILARDHRPVPAAFALGEVLASTPGKVIYRNALMELIQYAPATDAVQAEPVLIVPAWIMKYYVLDLSPGNSFIRWLVGQGFTVFCISWRNPGAEHADLSMEDYRAQGIMQALDVINAVVPGQKVHANGYCLGGTLLAITAAAMARDGDDRLASVTLMAAQLDFAEAGELQLLLDESQVALLEDLMGLQGYLDRPQKSWVFTPIRTQDLIWTRAVRRYYLGEPDLPADLTVWLNDTTRMPARMHSEYLRGIFLENRITAGRFAVAGRAIALGDIAVPLFIVGTETDHIAPWRAVYKTALFTDCDLHFVLTNGGHNGGILSEPCRPRRRYRIGHRPAGAPDRDPDTWLAAHEPVAGSWWPEWARWLRRHSAGPVSAPVPGTHAAYPAIEDAPGQYIHQS